MKYDTGETKPLKEKHLIAALSAVYFVSYLSRLNYGAVMVEMIGTGILTKEEGGVIGTALFIAYGVGQIVSGILGDRFSPQRIMAAGLILTAVCNFFMPFFRTVWIFTAIWGINGFAQALLWPPIVQLLSARLNPRNYERGCFWVTSAGQAATVAIYLLVPLCITVFDWRSVFWIAAGAAAVMAAAWLLFARRLTVPPAETKQPERLPEPDKSPPLGRLIFQTGLIFILFSIAMQGLLRDGITTWLPTIFGEVFGISASASVLISVILPLFGIFAVYLAGILYRSLFHNELIEAIFFFLFAGLLSLALGYFFEANAIVSLILAALITGSLHAVNLMLIGYVPRRFARYGAVSTVSGLTNAFTYVGSAISSFGFAAVADACGWNLLIWIWAGVCAAGIGGLAASYRRYRKQ